MAVPTIFDHDRSLLRSIPVRITGVATAFRPASSERIRIRDCCFISVPYAAACVQQTETNFQMKLDDMNANVTI